MPEAARPTGEDPRGLQCRRNPRAWLRDSPDVYDLVTELEDSSLGDPEEPLAVLELERRSHAELGLIRAYRAAAGRKRTRDEKRLMDEAMKKAKRGNNGDQT